jgi:hypothetical protein
MNLQASLFPVRGVLVAAAVFAFGRAPAQDGAVIPPPPAPPPRTLRPPDPVPPPAPPAVEENIETEDAALTDEAAAPVEPAAPEGVPKTPEMPDADNEPGLAPVPGTPPGLPGGPVPPTGPVPALEELEEDELEALFAEPGDTLVAPTAESAGPTLRTIRFQDTPLDLVLQEYANLTGRTMIRAPGLTAAITLRSQTPLTKEEAREAIEASLAMNGITFLPMGEKFLKVIKPETAQQDGLAIRIGEVRAEDAAAGETLTSQVVALKHIAPEDIVPVLQTMMPGSANCRRSNARTACSSPTRSTISAAPWR